jgi:hypothetical protein
MKVAVWLGMVSLLAVPAAAEGPQMLFSEKSVLGQIWANLTLTHLRSAEPYVPMVVGIRNLAKSKIVIDRSSMRLIGPDGVRYPMAGLKEVRGDYQYFGLDHRFVSGAGIPWEVWYRQRNLRESNFFPDIRASRRATVINEVVLRRGDGLIDLVYFRRPPTLEIGRPFVLEVDAKGWEVPFRLRLVLE